MLTEQDIVGKNCYDGVLPQVELIILTYGSEHTFIRTPPTYEELRIAAIRAFHLPATSVLNFAVPRVAACKYESVTISPSAWSDLRQWLRRVVVTATQPAQPPGTTVPFVGVGPGVGPGPLAPQMPANWINIFGRGGVAPNSNSPVRPPSALGAAAKTVPTAPTNSIQNNAALPPRRPMPTFPVSPLMPINAMNQNDARPGVVPRPFLSASDPQSGPVNQGSDFSAIAAAMAMGRPVRLPSHPAIPSASVPVAPAKAVPASMTYPPHPQGMQTQNAVNANSGTQAYNQRLAQLSMLPPLVNPSLTLSSPKYMFKPTLSPPNHKPPFVPDSESEGSEVISTDEDDDYEDLGTPPLKLPKKFEEVKDDPDGGKAMPEQAITAKAEEKDLALSQELLSHSSSSDHSSKLLVEVLCPEKNILKKFRIRSRHPAAKLQAALSEEFMISFEHMRLKLLEQDEWPADGHDGVGFEIDISSGCIGDCGIEDGSKLLLTIKA